MVWRVPGSCSVREGFVRETCADETFDDVLDVCWVGEDLEDVLWRPPWLHVEKWNLYGLRVGHDDVDALRPERVRRLGESRQVMYEEAVVDDAWPSGGYGCSCGRLITT